MALRALVVVLTYGLSGFGFLFMVGGALGIWRDEPVLAKLVTLIWLFAWVAHAHMSVAWIRDRTVARRWPVWGTVAGVASLASPLLTLLVHDPGPFLHRLQSALVAIALVAMFFLPGLLLAVYLVRFHLRDPV